MFSYKRLFSFFYWWGILSTPFFCFLTHSFHLPDYPTANTCHLGCQTVLMVPQYIGMWILSTSSAGLGVFKGLCGPNFLGLLLVVRPARCLLWGGAWYYWNGKLTGQSFPCWLAWQTSVGVLWELQLLPIFCFGVPCWWVLPPCCLSSLSANHDLICLGMWWWIHKILLGSIAWLRNALSTPPLSVSLSENSVDGPLCGVPWLWLALCVIKIALL